MAGLGVILPAILAVHAADLPTVARRVLDAADAVRDALNGLGHPGEPHDRLLWQPTPHGQFEVYDPVGDCAACGGAQYGTDDALNLAYGDLREALGMERLKWEGR